MLRAFLQRAPVALALLNSVGALAAECPPPTSSVRVLLHEGDVLAGRLTLLGNAPDSPDGRVAAIRELFAAAGCTQVTELGEGARRNVECIVPGKRPDTIVVGVNQLYDSIGSVALLPSLAEALAAAPREHTYRWVAFSPHGTANGVRPKGAKRLIDSLSDAERRAMSAMIHIGPIGFGDLDWHPGGVDRRLTCALERALGTAGLTSARKSFDDPMLPSGFAAPLRGRRAEGEKIDLNPWPQVDWSGANDWVPFRSAGIPVLGLHSAPRRKLGSKLDAGAYVAQYRVLAVLLALADEALMAADSAATAGS